MDEQAQSDFGGWQTSDLTYDAKSGEWWSICDQNGREASRFMPQGGSHRGRYVYRLSPGAKAEAEPIPIWWDRKSPDFDVVDASFKGFGTEFIDFEGIAADPTRAKRFFACTEGKQPWLTEMEYRPDQGRMAVVRTVRISTQGNHDRDASGAGRTVDPNSRWEGIAVSPDGKTIYLATEWTDSLARIYRVSVEAFGQGEWTQGADGVWNPPKVYPEPFATASITGGLTGLAVASHRGKTYLIALERNAPALHFIDLAAPQAAPTRVTLDLRAPAINGSGSGVRVKSVSPEGVAVDETGTLRLIGDPAKDSRPERDFYVPLEPGADEQKLKNLIPLVFSTTLGDLLP